METGIITIGDEIADGRVPNSNLFAVSALLLECGHPVSTTCAIKDDTKAIMTALQHFKTIGGTVLLCGGLGPTRDDVTRFAVADFLGKGGRYSRIAVKWLKEFLDSRNLKLNSGNRIQTWIPQGCRPLKNTRGTACGFRFSSGKAKFFAFPGVPAEFIHMVQSHVLPILRGKAIQLEKSIWTWGWPESEQEAVFSQIQIPHFIHFASLPQEGGLQIRASIRINSREEDQIKRMRRIMNDFWHGFLAFIPPKAIIRPLGRNLPESIVVILKNQGATISTAESCSAGYLSYLLTSVPGSSAVFNKGFITYSNGAKQSLLKVNKATLEKFGAVSEQTVYEMVKGVLANASSDYACAVSGIAGPGGGTPDKPVGTVVIGAGSRYSIKLKTLFLQGHRNGIRRRSAFAVLNLLREVIEEKRPGKILKKDLHK